MRKANYSKTRMFARRFEGLKLEQVFEILNNNTKVDLHVTKSS
jgi:hypothetical protein